MTPPQADLDWPTAKTATQAAVSFRVQTLKKRSDFLQASRGGRVVTPGFILQMRIRKDSEATGIRVGFTCSKKVGNAVARNRAKRRLREVARKHLHRIGLEGADYVLVGRKDATASLPFDILERDFQRAVDKLNSKIQ